MFVLCAVTWLAAGWTPDPRTWGVHSLAFLPRLVWVAAAAALALVVLPRVAARLGSATAWVSERVLERPVVLLVVAAAAGALFYWLRLRFQFLGDGVVWLDKIEHREEFHHFEPLATEIATAVARAGGNVAAAGRAAIVLGIAYVIVTGALCRTLWTSAAGRGVAWLLALAHPALLLFFGYVESYPYLLVLQVGFALVAARAAASPSILWSLLAAAILGLAIATHLQALGWLPALVLLPWASGHAEASPRAGAARRARAALVTGALLGLGSLAVALGAILLVGASPAQLLAQLGGASGLGGLRLSALFTSRRLIDLSNEIALVLASSLLLLVPAFVARGRAALRLAGPWVPIAALVPGPLLFLLLVPPHIGAARDWDLYLAVCIPVLLLAVEAWRRAFAPTVPASAAARAVAGRALALAGVVTLAWLGVQLDATRAARRMYVLQEERGTFGNFARGYANETLGMYWRDRDENLAREAYLRATQANPGNPRYFNNLATLQLRVNQIAPAREAFRRAYALGMHDWFVLHNLGLCELQLGDPAAAEPLFNELVQKRPQMWQGWLNRGLSRLDLGRAGEALADLDHALELAPREADVHYTRGLALRQLGRLAEARASFTEALRLSPQHQPARDALARLPAVP